MASKFTRLFVDKSVISSNGYALHRLVKYPATEGLTYQYYANSNISDIPFYSCTGGSTDESDIVIADTVDGVFVALIEEKAFDNLDSIKTVVIPDSVIRISNEAFKYSKGLTKVIFDGPHSRLTEIGNYVFDGCSSLTRISLPSGVTTTGAYTFQDCVALTAVTFGKNSVLTEISMYAFYRCRNLLDITIPDSVTTIGAYAFSNCTSLPAIVIPDSVITIGNRAFEGCTGASNVTIGAGCTSIGEYAFSGCTGVSNVSVGAGAIGQYAFNGCTSISNVSIGSGVTEIGQYAFKDCTGITEIVIPGNVDYIRNKAFSGCTNLTNVVVEGKSYVGNGALAECGNIVSLTTPRIGDQFFGELFNPATLSNYDTDDNETYVPKSLKNVIINDGITTIPSRCFAYCKHIENVVIPKSVTLIDWSAFSGCTSLVSLQFTGTVAEWNAIDKQAGWNSSVPADRVQCYDGDVILSA